MNASLLVTGGAGFIGANFVRFWRKHYPGDSICVLDALTYAGNLANLDGIDDIEFAHGDIRDQQAVNRLLERHAVDTIVNFAAESHVDRSIHGPDAFVQTNIVGTLSLLSAARRAWLDSGTGRPHRFHHISTDEVFGSLAPDDPPFTEASPYSPSSPYSASKAASDHLVRAWHHTYGLDTTISNCSNNYGPYQFPEKLIPLFLINCLEGRPLPIYGDGLNVRDWLHVEDHCRGIELVLAKGRPGETYNIGGGTERPNIDVIDTLCRLIDEQFMNDIALANRFPKAPAARGGESASLKQAVPDRPGHDRRYAIDATRILRELGFTTGYAFESGLEATLTWYLANESWWRSVLDGDYRQRIEINDARPAR